MKEIAIVTGGGRGIGAATARLLAERGYRVCINWCKAAAPAEALVAEIEAAGGAAFAVQADIARESEVLRLFDAVDRCGAPLKALVNNAGITGRAGRLEAVTGDTLEQVLNTNVKGLILASREAVKRMSTGHGGRGGAIINLSSGAVSIGSPGEYVWYAASKGAVDSFTLGLAKEVASEGIRVNAVAPGFVATEIHAASGLPDRLEKDAPKVPLGRAADPSEVAEAILWLLSDAASYTTGAILRVAGGR